MSIIKDLDDIKDLSLQITDKLVAEGIVKDCMDTDDDDEFTVQDIITEILCEKFNIEND